MTQDSIQTVASKISGTWTPQIPRATITNVSGKYQKIGGVVVASGQFTITASQTSNAYLEESSIPERNGSFYKLISGIFECNDTMGIMTSSITNDNVWFYGNNGVRIPFTSFVGKTLKFQISFIAE